MQQAIKGSGLKVAVIEPVLRDQDGEKRTAGSKCKKLSSNKGLRVLNKGVPRSLKHLTLLLVWVRMKTKGSGPHKGVKIPLVQAFMLYGVQRQTEGL